MSLFMEIEGLRGEVMTSAILRYLLSESQEIRQALTGILRMNKNPNFGIDLGPDTICCCEDLDKTDQASGMRLDLLLMTSSAIIGIENKINARIEKGQISSYAEILRRYSIRDRKRPLLILLAPESRRGEVDDSIGSAADTCCVSWETLLEKALSTSSDSPEHIRVIINELREYFEELSASPFRGKWVENSRNEFPPHGNKLQQKIIRKVWDFFPDSGPRIGRGPTWLGYYFGNRQGWYGFLQHSEILDQVDHKAEFVVVSRKVVQNFGNSFTPVNVRNQRFLGPDTPFHSWIVNYDESWSISKWRREIKPICDAYINGSNRI